MKYLKRFNEELQPWTYTQASKKLRDIGHTNRASRLEEWADKRRKDDEIKAARADKERLSKTPSFHLKIFKDRWDKGRIHADEPYLEGNFFIDIYYESDLFYDNEALYEFEISDKNQIQFPFAIGIMPADEETQEKFDKEKWECVYRNKIWPVNLYISLNSNNTRIQDGNSKIFWEEREDGTVLFSDRKEAMRFKIFFLESFNSNSDNQFGEACRSVEKQIKDMIEQLDKKDNYYWQSIPMLNGKPQYDKVPRDLEGNLPEIKKLYGTNNNEYYFPFGNRESNLKQIDMKYFQDAIRRMSINSLYRD
jgi:hypothetical protein